MITHLELDILECEVKWALGKITLKKASGGDGILADLFQILKYDALQVLHLICQKIWKTQQWPQDWERSVFILITKKCNAKECSDYPICLNFTINQFSEADCSPSNNTYKYFNMAALAVFTDHAAWAEDPNSELQSNP